MPKNKEETKKVNKKSIKEDVILSEAKDLDSRQNDQTVGQASDEPQNDKEKNLQKVKKAGDAGKKKPVKKANKDEAELTEKESRVVIPTGVEESPSEKGSLDVARDDKSQPKKSVSAEVSIDEKEPKEEAIHKSHKPNVRKNVHGKKYRGIEKLVEKGKDYEIDEAISLLKKTATTKFDSSVEIHINLNLDLTNPEHQIRGSVSMPAGLGKSKKICAIVGVDKQKEAKDAGADTVGGQDIIEKIEKGWLDFDVVVATPDMMPHIGKIGKTLGTKGLMPNPKTGTVTPDVERIINEIKKGKADYRVDASGTVHASVGKVSFEADKLKENIETFLSTIHNSKPASLKGTLIKSIFLTTTMGPSVKLQK